MARMKKKYTTFNRNLKKYREQSGYTATEFADMIGISRNTYLPYETQNREPSFSILLKIAKTLHVTTDELFGYSERLTHPISVDDKLPEQFHPPGQSFSISEDVLVYTQDRCKYLAKLLTRFRGKAEFTYWIDDNSTPIQGVTHWMPIPELRRGQHKEGKKRG